MAEAALKNRYGEGAVYGSLAYDFSSPALYPEEYGRPAGGSETAEGSPDTRTREQVKVRTRARTAPRAKQGIAPVSILGAAAAAFLLVTAISAQATLFAVSGESVVLEQTLRELETDQTRLRIAYESAFNLAEVEEYAVHTLGMQKPAADQIHYIDTAAPDKAVVVDAGKGDGFVDRASDFISDIGSYFTKK